MNEDLQKMLDIGAGYGGSDHADPSDIDETGSIDARAMADKEYDDARAFIAEMIEAGELDPLDGIDLLAP